MDPRDARIAALEEENAALRAEVAELRKMLDELRQVNEELCAQLGKNSLNSSLPPSRDDQSAREERRARAAKTAKRRDAQKKARRKNRGAKRELVPSDLVTTSSDHWPDACGCCGEKLRCKDVVGDPDRVQHLELPEQRPDVHEFRMHQVRCSGCGAETRAKRPADAQGPVFGPRLRALVTMLVVRYRLSRRDVVEYLGDVLGVPASAAQLSFGERRTTRALEAPYAEALKATQEADVVHADETSWSYGGIPGWLWVASTGKVAVFRIDDRRGSEAAQALLGPDRDDRVIVADRWVAYQGYSRRQACWAHLERTGQALVERGGQSARFGGELLAFIRRMFSLWHRFLDGKVTRLGLRREVKSDGTRLIERWWPRAGGLPTEARRLVDGLHKVREHLFTFTEVEGVEPTNNLAERDLRRGVLWRRTSFATRSGRGRRFVERTLTVVVSLRAQGRSVFEFLCRALDPKQRTPSLLPDCP